ncbi:sigma-54-dependent transcriptional regulator [Thermocrinis sp.]
MTTLEAKTKILLVEDDRGVGSTLKTILEEEGYAVELVDRILRAKEAVQKEYFHAVLLDLWLPDGNGLDFIKELRDSLPLAPIIVITGHGKTEHAVRAIKEGAFDFLEKPFSMDKLLITLRKALELSLPPEEEEEIVGKSRAIMAVKELINRVAKTGASVLILGESGVGKELVARRIHRLSQRKSFVDLNCANISDELFEAELFGYEKGAFTSALSRKQGKLELAHEGTLFLDEIGDLSPKSQAKLLRVLETKQFSRLGGNQIITSNFRLISASNRDLRNMVEEGTFREDLFHRIATLIIEVPPLRERQEDIPLLLEHFLRKFSCWKVFTQEAVEFIKSQKWKGNIRELKNFVERLCILHDGEEVSKSDVEKFLGGNQGENLSFLFEEKDLRTAKQMFEKLFIERKLKEYEGDVKRVAQEIGIDLSNLYRKIKNYGIEV